MSRQTEVVKKLVSIPTDALEWAKREAERNLSTANSEIVRAIRERMERDTTA